MTAVKEQQKSKPKVLILNPLWLYTQFEPQFSVHFTFLKAYESPLPTHEFLSEAAAAGVSAILTGGGSRITAAGVLDHLPSLRCIVAESAGVDYIDLSECRRRGIQVANAGSVYSDDCADYAVALLIDVLWKVSAADRIVRKEGSLRSVMPAYALGNRLRSKRIGIVGLGSIGFRIAKRLEAFGCSISYHSRQPKTSSVPYPYYSDIHGLAANSDVLILCCALTADTRHVVDKHVLSALGKDSVIINVARGPVIDEQQLVKSLREGEITGAGLDVFEHEPSVPEELFELDNVVLSPHLAFATKEALQDLFEQAKGNLLAFFNNKPLITPCLN